MNQTIYGVRDYTSGQLIQKLRTAIGLTQNGLAEYLGVSRRAIGNWEAGDSYPQSQHLRRFIELGVENQVFRVGDEAQEIRQLWRSTRQKLLLDEAWLADLLTMTSSPKTLESQILKKNNQEAAVDEAEPPVLKQPQLDWGEAPAIASFYGRETEESELKKWVVEEGCQVVGLIGLGGIGKSALAAHYMRAVAGYFEVVLWRSLRSAPACQALLDDCLNTLSPEALNKGLFNFERRFALLLEQLQNRRILLVLDNLETVLGKDLETDRSDEDYRRFLRRLGETAHQSCLIFTSREKPDELVPLEGYRSRVRMLRLASLEAGACQRLLAEKNVSGSVSELSRLIEVYGGNPLALKIAGQTIFDLFGGQSAPFLAQNELIFGGIRELIGERLRRLSSSEQTVLIWLAIMREPVTLDDLQKVLVTPLPRLQLLEAIEALYRHSLIERGHEPGSFILQPVALEFITAQFVSEVNHEIESSNFQRLIEHSLALAHAPHYIRQSQLDFLLTPVLDYLLKSYSSPEALETHLLALLEQIQARPEYNRGYTPTNLVTLLQFVQGDVGGLDLSRLRLGGYFAK